MTTHRIVAIYGAILIALATTAVVLQHVTENSKWRRASEYCETQHSYNPVLGKRKPVHDATSDEYRIVGDRRADSEVTADMRGLMRLGNMVAYGALAVVVLWAVLVGWQHWWQTLKKARKEQRK